ncbi:MAG: RibD family protein [Labilithrix sp.]|nr:RibD family protein [Labilithrix sp.]MCW5810752.1 RibD family protein [Labilithrix sp.]
MGERGLDERPRCRRCGQRTLHRARPRSLHGLSQANANFPDESSLQWDDVGRPTRVTVTVHVAASLDGRIAIDRAPTSLSTPEGRRSAHSARAEHDAVLVGSDTVRIDDPRLTLRTADDAPAPTQPLRVVLASALEVPARARLFDERGPVLVFGAEGRASSGAEQALRARGAEVALVPADESGMVALAPVLDRLAARGVRRLLVEGGSRVLTSFFRARLVDVLEVELAMSLLGAPGVPLVGALERPPRLTDVEVVRLGANVLVRGRVVNE